MRKTIKVLHNVPDDVLEQVVSRLSLDEIDARVAARGSSGLRSSTIVSVLREVREGRPSAEPSTARRGPGS